LTREDLKTLPGFVDAAEYPPLLGNKTNGYRGCGAVSGEDG